MSKKLKNLVVVFCLVLQVLLVVLYGFSEANVSNYGCLVIWCVCGVVIYQMSGRREMI